MSKVSDHIKPPVVGAVSCVVQRPSSKPVSLFDLGARFFVLTRAAAETPRAAAVKAGRRGASAALSAVAGHALYEAFEVKRYFTAFSTFFVPQFLCSTWNPVSSPRPTRVGSRRARGAVKAGRRSALASR